MILNRQAVLERIEHDHELYEEICIIFRDDAPIIIFQLKNAFNNGDIFTATRHAHSLKSTAANIGATDLSETARLIENALRAEDIKNIHTLFIELDQNLSLVQEALL